MDKLNARFLSSDLFNLITHLGPNSIGSPMPPTNVFDNRHGISKSIGDNHIRSFAVNRLMSTVRFRSSILLIGFNDLTETDLPMNMPPRKIGVL